MPSKSCVEPASGRSGPGNATKLALPSNPTGGKSERFKDRPKKFRRSKDGAQKGTDKKGPEDTDDEAEKKGSKGTNKLSYNHADVLEYCKDLENLLRTQRAKEYIPPRR